MIPVKQTRVMAQFSCLGDACADTCCKGWGMQLGAQTVALYKEEAPELLDAVSSGEAEFIMKRDAETDFCVKFDNGWCGIHKAYGDRMLGDACHFFPRATRSVGGHSLMTASMACPEIARLTLSMEAPCEAVEGAVSRLPHSLKEYAHEGLVGEEMESVHAAFLAHVRGNASQPERSMAQIASVARSLAMLPEAQWNAAVPFYLRSADGRLPAPEANAADPVHVLNALQGLIGASKVTSRPRLMQTVECMARALDVTLDWQTLNVQVGNDMGARYLQMVAFWREQCAAHYAPIMARWLEGQLSIGLFPFAGLGSDMVERATIIGVRFATLKLALMATCFEAKAILEEEELVRVVQGLSRFMDHLAEAEFSLKIYAEVGWMREARLRALVGDA